MHLSSNLTSKEFKKTCTSIVTKGLEQRLHQIIKKSLASGDEAMCQIATQLLKDVYKNRKNKQSGAVT